MLVLVLVLVLDRARCGDEARQAALDRVPAAMASIFVRRERAKVLFL